MRRTEADEPRPACKYDWGDFVIRDRRITDSERGTIGAVGKYADSDTGRGAHPGRELLAEDRGGKRRLRTVERHLKKAVKLGLLERTFSGSGAGTGLADVYRLTVPAEATTRHPDVDWSAWLSESDQSTNGSGPVDKTDQPVDKTDPTTRHLGVDPTSSSNQLSTTGPKQPSSSSPSSSTNRGASPKAAEASTVVGSETNGDDDDKELFRDGVEVAEVVGSLQRSDLKAAGIPDAATFHRFLAEVMPEVRTPWAYLRSCVLREDLKGLSDNFADWRSANVKAELAEAEARYGPVLDQYMTLTAWGRPRRECDQARVTALGEALEHGVTWEDIQDALLALDKSVPPAEQPTLTEVLAELVEQMAEPAAEDTPLPESGKDWTEESTVDNDEFWPPLANVDWGF